MNVDEEMSHGVQAVVSTEGVATATKMFTMGRTSAELAFVMPDKKTTYISVDSGYKPFLKFVADVEGDLSSGCLATAQLVQTSEPTVQGMTPVLVVSN